MSTPVRIRFKIGAYTPATMPMARLAKYLDNLASFLGEPNSVHLMNIEASSTVPVVEIDREAYPKVKERTADTLNGQTPESVRRARRAIEQDLAEDNADYGDLVDEDGAVLVRFLGANETSEPAYGPFSQLGTLDGVPIVADHRRKE